MMPSSNTVLVTSPKALVAFLFTARLHLALAVIMTTTAIFASASPVRAEAVRPLRVAVYKLDGAGMDPRVMRVVEDSLLAEVRKLQHSSAISMDEVKALLEFEADRQRTGCSDDSCLAEIAEALGADALIVGGAPRGADRGRVS